MEAKKSSQKLGRDAEEHARKFLRENGYTVLECNWRFQRYEIDIIGSIDNLIVFFEVKARSTNAFGKPEMFVTKKKRNFLIAAADHYLKEKQIVQEARFDIISILKVNDNFNIKHLAGAFYPIAK
jgi:putative endonuclease